MIQLICPLSMIQLITYDLILMIAATLQAEVEGQTITWLTPHALQQVLPEVDYRIMQTFLEFYEVCSHLCYSDCLAVIHVVHKALKITLGLYIDILHKEQLSRTCSVIYLRL